MACDLHGCSAIPTCTTDQLPRRNLTHAALGCFVVGLPATGLLLCFCFFIFMLSASGNKKLRTNLIDITLYDALFSCSGSSHRGLTEPTCTYSLNQLEQPRSSYWACDRSAEKGQLGMSACPSKTSTLVFSVFLDAVIHAYMHIQKHRSWAFLLAEGHCLIADRHHVSSPRSLHWWMVFTTWCIRDYFE